MLTYIGMQCMGKPSFDAVHEMDDAPDFYKAVLGICCAIPFEGTQRFDLNGSSIRRQILDENIKMLKSNGYVPMFAYTGSEGNLANLELERFPSGRFETNELVLELSILPYNILRMIGQEAPGKRTPHLKRAVKRRRHRTVINNLINMACHVTEHARKLIIGSGKSNVWRDVFQHVYYAFEYFAL